MGISILELVLRELRQSQFTADIAYPGQKYPVLKEPVAAVHLQKVDRANLSVTDTFLSFAKGQHDLYQSPQFLCVFRRHLHLAFPHLLIIAFHLLQPLLSYQSVPFMDKLLPPSQT